MSRGVMANAALLAAALGCAYFVWTREPTPEGGDVQVLNLREGLSELRYDTKKKKVSVARRKDKLGTYYWVDVTKIKPAPKPKPTPKGAEAAKAAPPKVDEAPKSIEEVVSFKGSKALESAMEDLSHLKALRVLNSVDDERRKEYGLTDSTESLTLTATSKAHTFVMGKKTYGNSDFYVENKTDGNAYVLHGKIRREFDNADLRYIQRKITRMSLDKVARLSLQTGQAKKTIEQKDAHKGLQAAYWTDSEDEKPNEMYKTWVKKLYSLNVREYLKAEDVPKKMTPLVAISLTSRTDETDSFRIARKEADGKGGSQYYLISDALRATVRLARAGADEFTRDLDGVIK